MLKVRSCNGQPGTKGTSAAMSNSIAPSSSRTRVANKYAMNVVAKAHETYNLPEGAINYNTVMSRVDRRNHLGVLGVEACITPCIDVEEILVALCVKLVKTGQPLDKTSFLKLATALVTGTPTQEKILAHRKRCGQPFDSPLLGATYYSQFIKRHDAIIGIMKGKKKDNNRSLWGNLPEHENNVRWNLQGASGLWCG